jgi:hypothetical protein
MTQNAINNTASILAVDNLTLDGNTISTTDTDGDLVITPDGTGVTTSTKDIHTSGVSFDTGTNVLGNFVDTTAWTPGIAFGGGVTGITYSTQSGGYSRIGNLVFIYGRVILTSKGSDTGTAKITGLPLTVRTYVTGFTPRWANITLGTNYTFLGLTATLNATTISIGRDGDNVASANITDVQFADNSSIIVSGFYFTT